MSIIDSFYAENLQVLNETSLWWFDRTRHITSNAVVAAPDRNVTIAKKCSVFPVEFVGELLNMMKKPSSFSPEFA